MPETTPQTRELDAWLLVFQQHRGLVETAIFEGRPLEERRRIIHTAQAEMPEISSTDLDELDSLAVTLDNKLGEMCSVVLGTAEGATSRIQLPPQLKIPEHLPRLMQTTCREERRWLFAGRMLEILDQYRDDGRYLVLKERDRLLSKLQSGITKVASAVAELNSYLLVEHAFDLEQRAQITQYLERGNQLSVLYKETLQSSGAGGIEAVLEDNYYTLKAQFLLTCAKLVFQLYGHASREHLEALLALKSLYVFQVPGTAPEEAQSADSASKYLNRIISRALDQVRDRARREDWPVRPILELYRYDARFGRKRPAISS